MTERTRYWLARLEEGVWVADCDAQYRTLVRQYAHRFRDPDLASGAIRQARRGMCRPFRFAAIEEVADG